MIVTKIFSQYPPIRALHLHPRHYTCLIQVEQQLYYYDCYSSLQLWSLKIQGDQLLAFSLDFNKVYALQGKLITTITKGIRQNICQTTVQNPDEFILNELFFIFIKDDQIILQNRETNQIGSIALNVKYDKILPLQQSKSYLLYFIAKSEQKLQLLEVNLLELKVTTLSQYQLQCGTIRICKKDEIHKKISLIVDQEITILSYQNYSFKLRSKSRYDRQIRDVAFFTFAQNTDSVGGKYKIQYLLILTDEGQGIDLLQLEAGIIKTSYKLESPVSHIYFNRLFDNSFITLSPKGEVLRINLFGYDKQWVCLGFKFVEVQCNEIYEQKQNDFQVTNHHKKRMLTQQQLDDYNLCIFSAQQMLDGKVKRHVFEI